MWPWRASTQARHPDNTVTSRTVLIVGLDCGPPELKVITGDVVIWHNDDIVLHTATAKDGSWDTGDIAAGASARITVTQDLSASYLCLYHPVMTGRIAVR